MNLKIENLNQILKSPKLNFEKHKSKYYLDY